MADVVKLLDKPRSDRGPDPLAWLESIATKVEVQGAYGGGGYQCRAEIGRWGDILLYVWGKGDTISRAAGRCADRVERMLSEGRVSL